MLSEHNLTFKAYRGLKALLLKREFPPGRHLAFRELAEQLHLSRTPMHNALHMLHKSGYLSHLADRGFYTRQNTAAIVLNHRRLLEALQDKNGAQTRLIQRTHLCFVPAVWQRHLLKKACCKFMN